MKTSPGRMHGAAGQLRSIVGQVAAPAGRLGWFSYGGSARVVLAVVLVAVAAGVAGAGFRLRGPVRLPRAGRTARTVILVTWGTAIVAYLVCLVTYAQQLIQQHLVDSRPRQPVFPITAACMIALFLGILYLGRALSRDARLGSAFVGAIAAPMIFEFPFDLIIMTRIYPATPDPALYWGLVFAAFLLEFSTLALLSLSPLVRLRRAAFFAFALMLLLFAVWALFGFGYPSAPLPFTFNAGSKVLAFVVAISLFLPQRGRASTPAPTAPDESGYRGRGDPSGRRVEKRV